METLKLIEVTPQNVYEQTLFCIKDIKSPGFESKRKWFEKRYNEGLKLKILKNHQDKMIGFIEYTPVSKAWRPIKGDNFMFIHCMYVYSKKDRNKGYGTLLVDVAEQAAKALDMSGLCVMTSKGSWMANKSIFEHLGFEVTETKDRFELMVKQWDDMAACPELIDWTSRQQDYDGWNLVYADQCPWHEKSAFDLLNTAMDFGIDLKIKKIASVEEAKQAPSGFGVFNLLHNGKLLEDHYISATRFKNILREELKIQ
ncbi:GNAT family N-acetyltransferase [Psychroserpens sp.]|uniref:GNAT family N-acetyltransferase n=1 Tax=Psychroserpens sp. TaxID=2020870 RepID=UPI001B0CEF91|nr:GNAT family N-acetyltransferase [Psychroserpens sp.]MBO6607486.1 GNAT family N-acetyltransferase [Psychroserpens sp.]MBO6632775.1 GNAT family N-acetyltransferase [Psychroserpens sp.]MBO6654436.1 GNAT family N-acetyltransferase [Psychroserpens sp.]MBO6681215.1 GNAT family N-acetyltransferase [Psychroserpens sp.]MBO6749828.1 GNAT family N-acetyltransferase [Psychroserpens sp.]